MKTWMHVFSEAYMTPEETRNETGLSLQTILDARNEKQIPEADGRKLLRCLNSRLATPVRITEFGNIVWEV